MWNILVDLERKQRAWVEEWHKSPPLFEYPQGSGSGVLEALCAHNFNLWHAEDNARDPHANDHIIATTKRKIDLLNQKRNDAIEALDVGILASTPERGKNAVLNSETPGNMVDRLFINALKIYHMTEAAENTNKSSDHRRRCLERTAILYEQRDDLLGCLFHLYDECMCGARFFKVYRQMKMYNDPSLNPVFDKAQPGRNDKFDS